MFTGQRLCEEAVVQGVGGTAPWVVREGQAEGALTVPHQALHAPLLYAIVLCISACPFSAGAVQWRHMRCKGKDAGLGDAWPDPRIKHLIVVSKQRLIRNPRSCWHRGASKTGSYSVPLITCVVVMQSYAERQIKKGLETRVWNTRDAYIFLTPTPQACCLLWLGSIQS